MATNMGISGTALLQLQGDWMKGEWLAAGKVVGEDFGSTPVRLDVRDGIDQCSRQVLAALDRPGFTVLTPHLSATSTRVTAIWAVANAYWNDPEMT